MPNSLPRVLHAGGDATGQHIELTLAQAVRDAGIGVLEYTLATRLVTVNGRAGGVEVLNVQTGDRQTFYGRHTVLASGGAGRIYSYTTNPEVATGDGVALAFRAGAQIMDMEFYQFHPTALLLEGVPTFLISEAMRGEGGVLRNMHGDPFMASYHPMAELAPRDVVARAMVSEMGKTSANKVLLDVTHLPAARVKSRFPTIYRFCLDHGLDITRSPIPVAPAAHYMMGGVKTNTWGETSLGALYACGEVACCAVHGANRLASNSLLDTLVFARRVVERTLGKGEDREGDLRPEVLVTLGQREPAHSHIPPLSLVSFNNLMWRKVGIVRNAAELTEACRVLYAWERDMPPPEARDSNDLANMLLLGRLIAEAALLREESRGAHFREDFPDPSPDWIKHIVLVRE